MTLLSKLTTFALLAGSSLADSDYYYDPEDRKELKWCEEHYDPTDCEDWYYDNKEMMDCLYDVNYTENYTEEECEKWFGGDAQRRTETQDAGDIDKTDLELCKEYYDPVECEEYYDGTEGMIDCLEDGYSEEECEEYYGGDASNLVLSMNHRDLKQLFALGSEGSETQDDSTVADEPTTEEDDTSTDNALVMSSKLQRNRRKCARMISDVGKCSSQFQDIFNKKTAPPFDQETCHCLATVLTVGTDCSSSRLKRLLPKLKVVQKLADELNADQLLETGCKI